MIVFPYGTDAPIYYWPIVTVSMIVVNVIVFILQVIYPEQTSVFMLEIGNGIHPVQWLTCNFLHADPMHLIGNMIFLWSFGLVVEGKLGPWKTLAAYLGIAVLFGAATQLGTLGNEYGRALGASAVIYGFMAMCLIWAPENCMECVLIVIFRFFIRVVHFEVSIKVIVGIYIALDLLVLCLKDGQMSTEYLHTMGAIVGLVTGLVLLKWKLVDCEHWDVFSVWAGLHKMSPEDRQKLEDEKPENKRRKAEEARKRQDLLIGEIRHAIDVGNAVPALMLVKRKKAEFPDWKLPEPEMLRMIQLLSDKKITDEAIAYMQEYITLYESKALIVRLRLVQMHLALDHVNAAIKELNRIDSAKLDARQRQYLDNLRSMAEQRKTAKKAGDGLYELAE